MSAPLYRAGEQLSAGGHTITFAADVYVGDPVFAASIAEVDGRKPMAGEPIPLSLLRLLRISH